MCALSLAALSPSRCAADLRMAGHFVQTRNRYGLQPDTAARIAALFNAQKQANAAGGGEELPPPATAEGSGATRQ